MVSPGALANIGRVYTAEAAGCNDPKAQERLKKQHDCMQFAAMVEAQRAQWIPVQLERVDGFDKLPPKDAESCLKGKITKLPPLSAQKVQSAFAALRDKIAKSNTFIPANTLASEFCIAENEATAALLLLGFEARHNDSGNFQFKAKEISSG